MRKIFAVLVAVVAVGCSTTPNVVVQYQLSTNRPVEKPAAPVAPPPPVVFAKPTDTQGPPEAKGNPKVLADQNLKATTVVPELQNFLGGPVTYDYVPDRQYEVFVAPDQQTNIVLEPGEQIMGQPIAGDIKFFDLHNMFSRVNGQPVVNLFVTALLPGKETTLTVLTDRRTYRFLLSSYERTYMPVVKFDYRYVNGMQVSTDGGSPASSPSSPYNGHQIFVYSPISSMDFNYGIVANSINEPAWAPVMVFDDGVRSYIQFPSARGASFAPALFVIGDDGKPSLANYTVQGTWYITTRFKRAELVLDKNAGNVITIVRRD